MILEGAIGGRNSKKMEAVKENTRADSPEKQGQ